MQKGFVMVPILIGILVIGGLVGAWYTKRIQIPGFTPPGCRYEKVQCFKAPCNPILVCSTLPSGPIAIPQTVSSPTPQSLLPINTPNNETLTPETAKQILPLDETANWKTYTSSKYSFSIKYPADWNVTESSPAVYFSPFSTIGSDSSRSISVEVIDRSIAPPLPVAPKYEKIRSISLGAEEVDVLQPNGPAGELYLVKTRKGKYNFGFYFGLNLDRKYDPVFNQMLASFTFYSK